GANLMRSRPIFTALRSICVVGLVGAAWVFLPPLFSRTPMAISPGRIPLGTVLPVSLENTLSSKSMTKGDPLEGSIAQDVPLPNKDKIPSGSKIFGSVLSVVSSEEGIASLTFRLDRIETKKESFAVVTGLRTLAPFTDIQSAQLSRQAGSESVSPQWATTWQIG